MAASDGSEYFELGSLHSESFAMASNSETVAEDEEELQWAALSRLPSQKRINYALLRASSSRAQPPTQDLVDVRKLSRSRRELVVKKALATTDQDNFRLLCAIKERFDRFRFLILFFFFFSVFRVSDSPKLLIYNSILLLFLFFDCGRVGLEVPKIEVRFRNLNVSANVQIGSRALPTLVNYSRDCFEVNFVFMFSLLSFYKAMRILKKFCMRLRAGIPNQVEVMQTKTAFPYHTEQYQWRYQARKVRVLLRFFFLRRFRPRLHVVLPNQMSGINLFNFSVRHNEIRKMLVNLDLVRNVMVVVSRMYVSLL